MDISPLSLSSPQLPPPPSSGTPFVPSIPLLLTENAPPLTQKKIAKLLSLQESMDWLRESFTANNGDLASWIEAHSSSSDPQRQSICFLLKTPELRQALVAHPFDFLLSIASFLEKQETQEAKQMLYQEIQRILQETTHSHELLSTAFHLLEGKSN